MFHGGKNDPKQKAKAVAFSMAQNIVLNPEIEQGIAKFCYYYPDLHTPQIMQIVKDKYFKPFASQSSQSQMISIPLDGSLTK